MDKNKRTKLIVYSLAAIVLLLGSYFLFIRPSIIGYTIYEDLRQVNGSVEAYTQSIGNHVREVENLREQLIASEANSTTYKKFYDEMFEKLEQNYREMKKYELEMQELGRVISEIMLDVERAGDLLKERDDIISNLRKNYESLSINAANNICCKMRVDNPRIAYFDIVNNRVVCSEHGNRSITC